LFILIQTHFSVQKILLERFQREHPGFDFSSASFNGMAPNPSQFMGGIDYNKVKETFMQV
jgi:hypothetical protein